METSKNITTNSALEMYVSQSPELFTLADLSCSSGPNIVTVAEEIIKKIGGLCHRFSIPAQDFSLSGAPHRSFVAGVPGSFFPRLFPRRSIKH
jgi:hypothetical protein